MLLPCQTKFINYINVFWRDCVPAGRTVTWLQQCSENPEFGTTLTRRLNQSRASAVLQSNLIAIKFGTTEARRLNWASESKFLILIKRTNLGSQIVLAIKQHESHQCLTMAKLISLYQSHVIVMFRLPLLASTGN